MAELAADAAGVKPAQVLVASTGVIGEPLPLAKIEAGIGEAARALSTRGLQDAADAILTTDLVRKIESTRLRVGRRTVTIAGICKGSGMIEPNMATMLAFVLTDAAIAPPLLRRLWREVADASFNRVTVDGEGSTSDTALLLANGVAGHAPLTPSSAGLRALRAGLLEVCESLARRLARDGEGATKLITVQVHGARSGAHAERAARRIANSMLVKTAIFGGDANWGRILQTVGAGLVPIDLERSEVRLCGVPVFRAGASAGPAARTRGQAALRRSREVVIDVRLGRGRGAARLWTCDLSYGYVRINAEYRT
jgi:glutamate N-acetyltransferase/amino-acid N-acetyltransferase